MTVELTLLAWTALLGLAQILIAGAAKRRVDGAAWALGSRDIQPPTYPAIAQRLQRAQDNLFETLPLFAIAVLAVGGTALLHEKRGELAGAVVLLKQLGHPE